MKIKNIGKVGIASLYSSNPGDAVRGYIDTENSHTSSITVNVLWANGIIEGDNFGIYGYLIAQYTFPQQSSSRWTSETFATPDMPGTWDLLGVLADSISVVGDTIEMTGIHDMMAVAGAWTIGGAAVGLSILNVGVMS